MTMGVKKITRALTKADFMLRKMMISHFIFSTFFTGHIQLNFSQVTDKLRVKIVLPDSDAR